jgi:hypothetical protein
MIVRLVRALLAARAALLATGCLGFVLASLALTFPGSASASAAPAGPVTLGPQADETNGTSMYTTGVF